MSGRAGATTEHSEIKSTVFYFIFHFSVNLCSPGGHGENFEYLYEIKIIHYIKIIHFLLNNKWIEWIWPKWNILEVCFAIWLDDDQQIFFILKSRQCVSSWVSLCVYGSWSRHLTEVLFKIKFKKCGSYRKYIILCERVQILSLNQQVV